VNFRVGLKSAETLLKAGTTVRAQVLLVGMHRQVADPAALAAKICADYGLAGKPNYTVDAKTGTVTGQQYVLSLAAGADGAFLGTVRGLAALAGNLGGAVSGLHDNWTAAFQQRDGATVKTRLVPVEKGIGYPLLQAEDDGKLVAIGHPIIADNPRVTLSLTRTPDWKNWKLEIHNSTDAPLTVAVRANPAFTGFRIAETVKLAPGSSVFRTVGE
jgi:hypothetical protein